LTKLTIAGIHIIEALVVLLVGIKVLKIRSLYVESVAARRQVARRKRRPALIQAADTPQAVSTPKKEENPNPFLKPLPVPEVLFSAEHEEVVLTEVPQVEEEKSILSSYIDDFFFDSPSESTPDNVLQFSKIKTEHQNEDEFITVQEENAELVRAMETLKREIGIPARN
jgi:heme exporter protein D